MTSTPDQQPNISRICLRDGKCIFVRSTSDTKPEISPVVMNKWQSLLNLVARTLQQPHALITRVDTEKLNILALNQGEEKIFEKDGSFPLGIGVYCEATMAHNRLIHVADAQNDAEWKDNPSVDYGLVSYIGASILWPDGEMFGTLCSLDTAPHHHSDNVHELMGLFKSVIETDLELLMEKQELIQASQFNVTAIRETHHRIKNHLNMLTNIMQMESLLEINTVEDFMKLHEQMERRIMAVAELHTLLAYGDKEEVTLDGYLDKIIAGLINTVTNNTIKADVTLERVVINEKQFMYFGIILNELITNSFRHAFQGHPDPRIEVELADHGDTFSLRYKDNGPGIPEGLDLRKTSSMGMQLISELTDQAGGTFTVRNEDGAEFRFSFPKSEA